MSNTLQQLKDAYADPAKRKLLMYAVGAIVMASLYFMMGGSSSSSSSQPRQRMSKPTTVLGVADSAESISQVEATEATKQLSDQMDKREKELASREQTINKVLKSHEEDMLKIQQQLSDVQRIQKAMSQLQGKEMQADRMINGSTQFAPAKARVGGENQALNVLDSQGNVLQRRQTQIVTAQQPPVEGTMIRTITQRNVRVVRESGTIEQQDVKTTNISQRTQNVLKEKTASKPADVNQSVNGGNEGEFALTMGSIVSGVLVNGVYAPTTTNGQKDPVPILLRVKKEAIMPNYYTLDIRDCHMLASAIGDLATERAYIRAEAISCITESGQSIEKNITAYAVSSEDGTAGIPGDVIFKSGAMLANSLKADFLANFGRAIAPQRVQSLNTTPGDTQLWQSQNVNYAATSGIAGGIGGSAERLANYYMQMAENAHPTIEIMPGLEVDFIVQKGMTMKLEAPTDVPENKGQFTISHNGTASTGGTTGTMNNSGR